MVCKTCLIVQIWMLVCSSNNNSLKVLAIWVSLPMSPYDYYNNDVIRFIDGMIGKVFCIDYNTSHGQCV